MRSRRFLIRSISWSANFCCTSQCRRKPTTASRLSLAWRSACPISSRIICLASVSSTSSTVFTSAVRLSSSSYSVSVVFGAGIRSVATLLFSFLDFTVPQDSRRRYLDNSDRTICGTRLLEALDRLEQFLGAEPRWLAALELGGVRHAVPPENLSVPRFALGSSCLSDRLLQSRELFDHPPW